MVRILKFLISGIAQALFSLWPTLTDAQTPIQKLPNPPDYTSLEEFDLRRQKMNRIQMAVLTGWATGNLISGSIGWATTQGSESYFHIGNVGWNVVNLSIALPGLIRKPSSILACSDDFAGALKAQKNTQLVYVLNGGLDFAYLGTGLWLLQNAKHAQWMPHMQRGLGRTLVMQGSFLLVFDFANYLIHTLHGRRRLSPLEQHYRCRASASPGSLLLHF
ncbi:MAG: hypothetical protein N2110_10240 [Flavobacteriales bacterium]|nr:hypothetical protein [Flavobacteriales bacterium]MCX7769378.1 hypothetical protein [Flavobacteriales bacterium]MDW8410844.1 hypothetical protein [Flavobacteriales bacterium]